MSPASERISAMSHDSNQNSKWDPIELVTFHDWNGNGHKDMTDYLLQQAMFEDTAKTGDASGSPSGNSSSGKSSWEEVKARSTTQLVVIAVLDFILLVLVLLMRLSV